MICYIFDISLMPDQLTLMNLFCLAEEIQRKLLLSRWFLLNCPGDGAPFYSFKRNFIFFVSYCKTF